MSRVLDMWAGMTGTVLDFAGTTAPDGWLLCFGQSLLRADYPNLFERIGTTYGAADGTHFSLPDCRGRASAGKDDMGGAAANRLNVTLTGTRASTGSGVITGLSSTAGLAVGMAAIGDGVGAAAVISSIDSGTQVTLSVNSSATGSGAIRFGVVDGATLGATGGDHVHTLTTSQMPQHNHGVTDPGHAHAGTVRLGASGGGVLYAYGGTTDNADQALSISSNTTGITVNNNGGGTAQPNAQPTIVFNKIIKT